MLTYHYGAYLSQKHEVIFLDTYQPQIDAINTKGVTIVKNNGDEQVFTNGKVRVLLESKA